MAVPTRVPRNASRRTDNRHDGRTRSARSRGEGECVYDGGIALDAAETADHVTSCRRGTNRRSRERSGIAGPCRYRRVNARLRDVRGALVVYRDCEADGCALGCRWRRCGHAEKDRRRGGEGAGDEGACRQHCGDPHGGKEPRNTSVHVPHSMLGSGWRAGALARPVLNVRGVYRPQAGSTS